MEFNSQQLTDLEGLLWRAAEDFDFQKEFVADPLGVIARDTGVQLAPDAGVRVLYSCDAALSLVLPVPQGDPGSSKPTVVYPEYEAVEADVDAFKYLAPHLPAVLSRCLDDADYRARLISDPRTSIQEICEVEIQHELQFIDPRASDYTLILPKRDVSSPSRPVVCAPSGASEDADPFGLPGVTVHSFGQPEEAGELSDQALQAVVGGTMGAKDVVSGVGSAVKKTVRGTAKFLGL